MAKITLAFFNRREIKPSPFNALHRATTPQLLKSRDVTCDVRSTLSHFRPTTLCKIAQVSVKLRHLVGSWFYAYLA